MAPQHENRSHPAVDIQRQPHPRQHQHRAGSGKAFRWSVILNSGLSALQLAIGVGFGSLALIGDAVHNLGIALTAHVVRRPLEIDDMDLLHQAKQRLAQLGIAHSTIQLEPPDH